MLTRDLFHEALIKPCTSGADQLLLVSGYLSASMFDKHLAHLQERRRTASVSAIYGMVKQDGIDSIQHHNLVRLAETTPYGSQVRCRYAVRNSPVHAKVYVWLANRKPVVAFAGSANYTQTGFSEDQREALAPADPQLAYAYYQSIYADTEECQYDDIPNLITIRDNLAGLGTSGLPSFTLSLLTQRTGEVHDRGGLNWGQRKGREPNQAYIHVPSKVQKSDFFPTTGVRFTVLTDDHDSFIFVRAQANGKGLHTTQNNSQLGAYIRKRIGVPDGAYVTRQDLEAYGRTNVTFYKIEEDTYFMDFSIGQDEIVGVERLED